jgi:nucleoside-diphosphate-sugar epimerase
MTERPVPGLEPAIAKRLSDSGHRIIITGASGWIGLATVDLLAAALGDDFAARVCCFGSSARDLVAGDGRVVAQRPLSELAKLPPAPSLLLHLAFLTKDKVAGLTEAAMVPIDVRAIWVASSGAACRADDPDAAPAMQLYGRLKLDDEARFADWASHTGRRAVITRVFNVSGPHINKPEHYALASFILDALAAREVAVKAPHRVERGMVAIRELMSVVFAELLAAPAGVARFDSGGIAAELGEIAAEVAHVLGAPGARRAAITSPRVDQYLGNETAWAALCHRHGVSRVGLAEQIRETADFLAANAGRA